MRYKTLIIAGVLVTASACILLACQSSSAGENGKKPLSQTDLVKRGEYLVNSIGCDDCHSPKRMGDRGPEIIDELRLSGYPADRPVQPVDTNVVKKGWVMMGPDLTLAVGPWGMSFASNISSDETGIGNWSDAQFLKAMREGKFKGLDNSRPLLPPMPWMVYRNLTDEDIRSIFAYLKSSKPVQNVVPAPIPFNSLK